MNVLQYIYPATTLIVFAGMLAVVWRSLAIAHDLSKIVLSAGLSPRGSAITSAPAVKPATPQVAPSPPGKASPAPADPVVDAALIDFIKKEEGFVAKAAWDYKQYTIGYGTKATSPNEIITPADAEVRLRSEIAKADAMVTNKFPSLPRGVHQALLDLTYNAGSGWETQGLGEAIAAGDFTTAKSRLLQYNHAGGAVNAGLTKRREAEATWFDNPL